MRLPILLLTGLTFCGLGLPAAETTWDQLKGVLDARCIECHGEKKQKAGLRLDSPEWLAKGSKAGPIVVPGNPTDSKLYSRALLPDGDDDRMPPKGDRLTAEQLAIINGWITSPAPTAATTDKPAEKPVAPPAPEDQMTAPTDAKNPQGQKKTDEIKKPDEQKDQNKTDASGAVTTPAVPPVAEAPVIPAPAAPQFAITALVAQQYVITTLPGGWLDVNAAHTKNGLTNEHLPLLAKIGPAVAFLDLANSGITDKQLKVLADFTNLQRLHLEKTPVTDAGLAALSGCPQLTYLNLFGTEIGDGGLAALRPLKNLEELFVWQTKTTPAGIAALKKVLPELTITSGPDELPADKLNVKKKRKK